jgi:hypothetical protein
VRPAGIRTMETEFHLGIPSSLEPSEKIEAAQHGLKIEKSLTYPNNIDTF